MQQGGAAVEGEGSELGLIDHQRAHERQADRHGDATVLTTSGVARGLRREEGRRRERKADGMRSAESPACRCTRRCGTRSSAYGKMPDLAVRSVREVSSITFVHAAGPRRRKHDGSSAGEEGAGSGGSGASGQTPDKPRHARLCSTQVTQVRVRVLRA